MNGSSNSRKKRKSESDNDEKERKRKRSVVGFSKCSVVVSPLGIAFRIGDAFQL